MERTKDGFRLSSGREFYANSYLVSIALDDFGSFRIGGGYDGTLCGPTGDEYDEPDPGERDPNWAAAECIELADFMISQWEEFKQSAVNRLRVT